jgi:hypothetical protein
MQSVWMFDRPQMVRHRVTFDGKHEVTIEDERNNPGSPPLILLGDREHILSALEAAMVAVLKPDGGAP